MFGLTKHAFLPLGNLALLSSLERSVDLQVVQTVPANLQLSFASTTYEWVHLSLGDQAGHILVPGQYVFRCPFNLFC